MTLDWKNKPLDAQFLLDSGLLFEANRTIFHLLGIALTVKKNPEGKLFIDLKDHRQEPDKLLFDKEQYNTARLKYEKFMRDFGDNQLDRRCKKLGFCCQSYHTGRTYARNSDT